MKVCKVCDFIGEDKEFAENRLTCIDCYVEREKARYHANKAKHKAKRVAYGLKNKERIREKATEWYRQNKEKAKKRINENYNENKEVIILKRKLKRHNLTIQQLEIMKNKCNDLCQICGKGSDKICIDHNHINGKVRGLLCNNCNSGIGFLRDDVKILKSAISYLSKSEIDTDEEGYSAYYFGMKKGILPT
jgi:hypothetical protein